MSRSNVVSLADFRARREGWQSAQVEPIVFPTEDGGFTLRLVDPEDTYEVTSNREWLEALHAKLGRVLGK